MDATVDATMATKKKAATDEGKQIGIRLSSADYRRLEKLSARLPVGSIARVALLLGLEIIEQQPGVLVGETPKRR
jgi:hypothetical protein